ncbi:MAG: response regulator transcription factor [Dehalococcoidia bacterium]|nr:response regulator transcription factor [Dehalococcoidia bacterium]
MTGKRILVVDDDAKIVELVKLYLARDGHKVITALEGNEALRIARESHPDLIVLDLLLPGINGFEVCRALRAESDVPIIMLTARTTEQDKLEGLDLGADDYMTKPFSPRELAARVRAVLRRLPEDSLLRGPAEIVHGDLRINFSTHEAWISGRLLKLTPMEFRLLGVLAKEPGVVFSRSHLVNRVFGYDFDGFDRTVDVHVLNLRRKIEPDPEHPIYVKTVYGAGYKFDGGPTSSGQGEPRQAGSGDSK